MISYIISLKNPANLIQEAKTYGFNPVLIEGVYGNNLTLDEKINETGDYLTAATIPTGVLGCALAHLKTWKTFLSTNEQYCVIFEDDVVFESNFKNNFDLCFKQTPSDFDIFYIGCLFGNIYNFKEKKINKYIKIPFFFLGAHSYVISRKGSEKLVKYIDKNIYTHIDVNIYKLYTDNKLTVYSTIERLVYQTSTDDMKTSFNISNNFPSIIDYLSSFIEVDKKIRLNYCLLVPIKTINGYNINTITFLFLILGIVLHRIPVNILLFSYIFLSLPDILYFKNIYEFFIIGIIFLFPALYFQTI
jgi:GR25 family glycosyltransferase involved in LPS biosynthesis